MQIMEQKNFLTQFSKCGFKIDQICNIRDKFFVGFIFNLY